MGLSISKLIFNLANEFTEAIQNTAFDFGNQILGGTPCGFLGLFRLEDLGQFLA